MMIEKISVELIMIDYLFCYHHYHYHNHYDQGDDENDDDALAAAAAVDDDDDDNDGDDDDCHCIDKCLKLYSLERAVCVCIDIIVGILRTPRLS